MNFTTSTIERDRSITTRYLLIDTTAPDSHGDKETAALEITTHHYKERKAFIQSVSRIIVGDVFIRQTISYGKGDPIPSRLVGVARYSAKALEASHAENLARAEAFGLDALMEWAANADRR
jgi:hypothetical protein